MFELEPLQPVEILHKRKRVAVCYREHAGIAMADFSG